MNHESANDDDNNWIGHLLLEKSVPLGSFDFTVHPGRTILSRPIRQLIDLMKLELLFVVVMRQGRTRNCGCSRVQCIVSRGKVVAAATCGCTISWETRRP